MTRTFLRIALAFMALAASQGAQALVLAVNEGVTYRGGGADDVRAKYATIAADLGRILKQNVTVEPIGDYATLRKGLAAHEYDLAYVHPAHVSILAVKNSGYQLVAVTKGWNNYKASFLVRSDAPYKGLADLRGLTIGAPDEDSITSWMVRATLRDAMGSAPAARLIYTRYQDAVPFFIENDFARAGATASASTVKAWQAKGGKVLATSRPVPVKDVLAGPSISAEQVLRIREYLVSLDGSEEGKKKLEPLKYEGFMAYEQAEFLAIGKWLGL